MLFGKPFKKAINYLDKNAVVRLGNFHLEISISTGKYKKQAVSYQRVVKVDPQDSFA
jgi:hypothetical protein